MGGHERLDSIWRQPLRRKLVKKCLEGNSSKAEQVDTNVQIGQIDPAATQAGPHADEKRMPKWLVKVLEKENKLVPMDVPGPDGTRHMRLKVVETPGLVPALAQLSRAHPNVRKAVYCSPYVHHVAKLRREGSFCGYRNIQMMISYFCNSKVQGCQQFDQQLLPSIFTLQDMIEKAWDNGFNTSSRDEIGHVRMTRKFIGTSEAEAVFLDSKIPVVTRAFVSSTKATAFELLVTHVSDYFDLATSSATGDNLNITSKPPIFLQRPGHSMTIVGIDEDVYGARSLMIFDPKYQPTKALKRMALGHPSLVVKPDKLLKGHRPPLTTINPEKLLKAHRYGLLQLGKFEAFEVVQLVDGVTAQT